MGYTHDYPDMMYFDSIQIIQWNPSGERSGNSTYAFDFDNADHLIEYRVHTDGLLYKTWTLDSIVGDTSYLSALMTEGVWFGSGFREQITTRFNSDREIQAIDLYILDSVNQWKIGEHYLGYQGNRVGYRVSVEGIFLWEPNTITYFYDASGQLDSSTSFVSQNCGSDDPIPTKYHYVNGAFAYKMPAYPNWVSPYRDSVGLNAQGEIDRIYHQRFDTTSMQFYTYKEVRFFDRSASGPTVGLNENEVEEWQIYPNPFRDQLHFQAPDYTHSEFHVMLYDALGREVLHETSHAQSPAGSVSTAHLPSGWYVHQIVSGNQLLGQGKLVKL